MTRRGFLAAIVAATAAPTGCSNNDADGLERSLAIATGPTSGAYHAYGEGLAAVLGRELHTEVTTLVSGGSEENIQSIVSGKAHIAFTHGDTASAAYTGETEEFQTQQPIRTVARIYDDYVHLVVRAERDIDTLADLEGHAVSTGARNSGTDRIAERLLDIAKIDPEDDIDRERTGIDQAPQQLADEEIDAFFWTGGLPTRAITELADQVQIRLIDLSGHTNSMREHHGPYYQDVTIVAGFYNQINRDVRTLGVPVFLVVHETEDENVVFQVTRALFDNKAEIAEAHEEGRRLDARTAIYTTPVPLHQGAMRYYRSIKP